MIDDFYDELDRQEQEYENQEYWEQQKDKEIERLNKRIDKALEFIYLECYDENRTKPIDDLNYYQIEEFVSILKEGVTE